ncbi:uncharacterized protein PFL1_02608 [Pseudozyma flocculosa PF-1]|uniref:RNA helicase n=2 Tax=Pseudozyma flocculosa TaxID=84751 RepID=A0A5C3EZM1_9BASI|nr:uncharacterized protein PFL1_02608 [Pseudozyma flocculosa PF-1]EPQ29936.1 hypothetical protein PFL1_02608 [Pseudozyma flocculosa PF-1]SPO37245.1 related to TIF2 - translation initiation factor eIF4A [Pseudozyma flocculosa]
MSGSPFIPDNSIWSNAAVSSHSSRPHSPHMPGSLSFAGAPPTSDPSRQPTSDRTDAARLAAHPLPSRPVQSHGQRSASVLFLRGNAHDDHTRSLDSHPAKQSPGAIGGHRIPSRDMGPHLSRSNSLAASVSSFRSANSASPAPSFVTNPATDLDTPISAGKHLFQRQNSTNGALTGSPTSKDHHFFQSGSLSPNPAAHGSRDNNVSGETDYGTPRLFLDSQHVFGGGGGDGSAGARGDGGITHLDGQGWDLERSPSLRSNAGGHAAGRPRPKSWIQPQNIGSSLSQHGDRTVSQPHRSDSADDRGSGRAASAGVPSPKASLGFDDSTQGDGHSATQGYPFPASAVSQRSVSHAQPSDAQLRHDNAPGGSPHADSGGGVGPLTSSPIESSDGQLHHSSLSVHDAGQQRQRQQQQSRSSNARGGDRGGGSPAPTSAGFAAAQNASGGRGTPSLNLPRNLNLVGGLLSPTAATVGSMAAAPALSPLGSPSFAHRAEHHGHQAVQESPSSGALDDQLRQSALLNELIDRLGRVEAGMKDFSRQVSGISRNVSLLLERTKALPPASLAGGGGAAAATNSGNAGTLGAGQPAVLPGASQDEIRALNSQVAALASSVSHLLTVQGTGASAGGSMSQLAGLGIGATPYLGTPQLGGPGGGIERTGSPRVGGPLDAIGRGLSPRPGMGGRGWSSNSANAAAKEANEARWSALGGGGAAAANGRKDGLGLGPGTPSLEDASRDSGAPVAGSGFTLPNAIVTKWEHLNLHPDLLRSILKYGLGPPNKIQQRALPFLLRGSDIIAQAPPTQERIASYVIPALQLVLNAGRENAAAEGLAASLGGRLNLGSGVPPPTRGPVALIISTTVDQATQAQRMALGLGASLGIRVHIAAAGGIDVHQEAQAVVQSWPHIVVGTPQKMSELFTYLTNNAASLSGMGVMGNGAGGVPPPISTAEVRLVVLDEVDQLIARNLADHVSTLLRVLPQPSPPAGRTLGAGAAGAAIAAMSPGLPSNSGGIFNFGDGGAKDAGASGVGTTSLDRQVALFSNTVPQDVLNFAQSIHLRESVRVLVRRDGGSALPAGTTGGGAGAAMGGVGSVAAPQSGFLPSRPGHGREGTQPSNALGAHPVNSSINVLNDPIIAALKGLRQYYLYVAVTSNGGGGMASPNPGMGPHAANEMKLDLITDLMEDIEYGQAVVYCANSVTLEAVIYKLASKGVEAVGLTREMNSYTRQQMLARFRSPTSQFGTGNMVGTPTFAQPAGFAGGGGGGARTKKVLVVCDMAVHPKDVHQVPLIVFYDMPRSVDEYKEKIACASAGAMARPSVCINVVTASGGPRGDVEMLRTLECHLGCKMAELPIDAKQILNF